MSYLAASCRTWWEDPPRVPRVHRRCHLRSSSLVRPLHRFPPSVSQLRSEPSNRRFSAARVCWEESSSQSNQREERPLGWTAEWFATDGVFKVQRSERQQRVECQGILQKYTNIAFTQSRIFTRTEKDATALFQKRSSRWNFFENSTFSLHPVINTETDLFFNKY